RLARVHGRGSVVTHADRPELDGVRGRRGDRGERDAAQVRQVGVLVDGDGGGRADVGRAEDRDRVLGRELVGAPRGGGRRAVAGAVVDLDRMPVDAAEVIVDVVLGGDR